MRPRSLVLLGSIVLAACGSDHDHEHDHGHEDVGGDAVVHGGHSHDPRHGGALVALGDEYAHVELGLDAATGTVTLWLYDREVEPVRSAQPTITFVRADGEELELAAVASALTGETVGDASKFQATSADLVGATELDGRLVAVRVLGREFADVPVRLGSAE